MNLIYPEHVETCTDIFNELELGADTDRQISTLDGLRSSGFVGTLISIIATMAFLYDEHSKITSTETDDKGNEIKDAQGNVKYDKIQTFKEDFTFLGIIPMPKEME